LGRAAVAGPSREQGIGFLGRVSGVVHDRQALAGFYAAARDDCLRIVLVSVVDRQLARTRVAETCTKAWRSWRKVPKHPVRPARVVRTDRSAPISWWGRRRRDQPLASHGETAATPQHPWLDSSLVAALRRLPVRQRQVIALRVLLDLDTATTAQML